jgi:hypothetical protein
MLCSTGGVRDTRYTKRERRTGSEDNIYIYIITRELQTIRDLDYDQGPAARKGSDRSQTMQHPIPHPQGDASTDVASVQTPKAHRNSVTHPRRAGKQHTLAWKLGWEQTGHDSRQETTPKQPARGHDARGHRKTRLGQMQTRRDPGNRRREQPQDNTTKQQAHTLPNPNTPRVLTRAEQKKHGRPRSPRRGSGKAGKARRGVGAGDAPGQSPRTCDSPKRDGNSGPREDNGTARCGGAGADLRVLLSPGVQPWSTPGPAWVHPHLRSTSPWSACYVKGRLRERELESPPREWSPNFGAERAVESFNSRTVHAKNRVHACSSVCRSSAPCNNPTPPTCMS